MVEPVALHACGFIGCRGARGRFGVDGNWRGGIEGRIKNCRVRQVGINFFIQGLHLQKFVPTGIAICFAAPP